MAYTAKKWADHPAGKTVIDAASLNRIENGLAAAATVADAAATSAEVKSLAATTVEQQEALDVLAGRLDELPIVQATVHHVTWNTTALTANATNTLKSVTVDSPGGLITADTSGNVTLGSACLFALGAMHVYTSWSGATAGRRRWQLISTNDAMANVATIGGTVLASTEYYSGDRASIPLALVPNTSFQARPFTTTACNAGAWARIVVFTSGVQ